ncbi:MAG: hypothetical protein EOP83_06045 [Verrucomicrobiaceae bacterium]|nr:MAG: hypothetical protein EOP83_06045 [Verrucomicrobiaceae bacterium]
MVSIVLPYDSPLILGNTLAPAVRFWCREKLNHTLCLAPDGDDFALVFYHFSDMMAFKARWMK